MRRQTNIQTAKSGYSVGKRKSCEQLWAIGFKDSDRDRDGLGQPRAGVVALVEPSLPDIQTA